MKITNAESIMLFDPSELYRPETKNIEDFRIYSLDQDDVIQRRVRETYRLMHTYQTVDFVRRKEKQWCGFDHARLTVLEALELLNTLVDESDPDVDIPNSVHAFQTVERARAAHPSLDWLHLTGLVHDLGKVLAVWGEPQWAVVGDTFPVGCRPAPSIVYSSTSFGLNPDLNDPRYASRFGMYEEGCGLDQVKLSWGHDEYMYRVLVNHGSTLPTEALYMIRYHSFYPWHTGGDYDFLCNDHDRAMLPWVREFNKFDLYSKSEEEPDVESLLPYYRGLIDKYIPGTVCW